MKINGFFIKFFLIFLVTTSLFSQTKTYDAVDSGYVGQSIFGGSEQFSQDVWVGDPLLSPVSRGVLLFDYDGLFYNHPDYIITSISLHINIKNASSNGTFYFRDITKEFFGNYFNDPLEYDSQVFKLNLSHALKNGNDFWNAISGETILSIYYAPTLNTIGYHTIILPTNMGFLKNTKNHNIVLGINEQGDNSDEVIFQNVDTASTWLEVQYNIPTTPKLSVSPLSLSFSNQTVNTESAYKSFTVSNTGTASITGLSISENSSQYRETTTCSSTLSPSSSCSVKVYFKPTYTGFKSGTVSVSTSNAGNKTIPLSGTGITPTTPTLSVSPSSLSFSNQTVNTESAYKSFTVSNTGTASITGLSISENSSQYRETTTCSSTLSPSSSCSVKVYFKPTYTGSRLGTVSVSTSNAGSKTISLSGTGITPTTPTLSVGPISLSFSNQTVNTESAYKSFTVSNIGTASITGLSISDNSSQYRETTTCSSTLSPSSSCSVKVYFKPTYTGSRPGTVSVSTSNAGSITISLSGTGITPTTPTLSVSPISLSFSNQTVNTESAYKSFTVSNTGTATITGLSISDNSSQYRETTTCSSTLSPSSSCSVKVYFKPTYTGSKTGTVSVSTSNAGNKTVSLSGTGITPTTPTLSLSATIFSFGDQTVNTESFYKLFGVRNTGTTPITGLSISDNSNQYRIEESCSSTLNPASTHMECTVKVYFKPTSAGIKTGTLTVSASNAESKTIPLSGTGIAATTPILSVSTTPLSFSDQTVDTESAYKSFTVSNAGTAAITNLSISENSSSFRQTTTCSSTLNPSSSCSVKVYFKPTYPGFKSGTVSVSTSNAGSKTISLSGTGITPTTPTLSVSPSSLSFSNQTVNTESAYKSFTVSNTGTASITGLSISENSSQYRETTTCSSTLSPSSSCSVKVYFKPTSSGLKNGTLSITSSNAGNMSTSLSGSGISNTTNNPPTADAGSDQTVTQGSSVTLDASGSSDSDGTIVSYEWKEGNTVLWNVSSFSTSAFAVGKHTITLTVKDNDGATASDTVVVTVGSPLVVTSSAVTSADEGSLYSYTLGASGGNGNPLTWNVASGTSLPSWLTLNGTSSWEQVGTAGFSASGAVYTSIAFDNNNTPYVVYADGGNNDKASVMKFDGSAWVQVGTAGFSAGGVWDTSITIDSNNIPYVVYQDFGNSSKASVMKFNGSSWVQVGTAGFSAGEARYPSIEIDSNNTPYVVYEDGGNSSKASVMKFNGSAWEYVGTAGFSADSVASTSIAFDSNNTPYVVYQDYVNSYKASVMKFNGSSWVQVGTAGFSAGGVYYTSIEIDSNNTPYVVYTDYGNSKKASVMKFNGSAWVQVGTAGFSAGVAYYTSIAFDSNNTPYVVYQDYGNNDKASVMKFNGSSWVQVGTAEFSAGRASCTSIAFDSNNTPYVVYEDGGNNDKASVMKFNDTVLSGTPSNADVGDYNINLIVSDGSTTVDHNFMITVNSVNNAPTANTGADQTVTQGSSVTLDASGSSDSDGTIVGYEWKEGNTILSNASSFSTSTFTIGRHTITLTVKDNDGATASDTVVITVTSIANIAPTADAGSDQTVTQGSSVTLDASGSSDSDGTIVGYEWKDGNTVLSNASSFPTSAFAVGRHTITLTVKDNDGATASDSVIVTIINQYTGAWTGTEYVYLTQNPSIYCRWNLTVDVESNNTATASAVLTSENGSQGECDSFSNVWGNITDESDNGFKYTVTDTTSDYIMGSDYFNFSRTNNQLKEDTTFTLFGYQATRETVLSKNTTNTAPTANAGADQTVTQGSSVTLNASGSSDSGGTIVSYEWEEGNTVLSVASSFPTSAFAVGRHTITLTVTDNDGATASDEVLVTVIAKPVSITIKPSWNLISLPDSKPSAYQNAKILWTYENSAIYTGWKVYSPLSGLEPAITKLHLPIISDISSDKGYWYLSDDAHTIDVNVSDNAVNSIIIDRNGWNLLGTMKDISVEKLSCSDGVIESIWKYKDGKWLLNTQLQNSLNAQTFDTIHANEGFWVNCR